MSDIGFVSITVTPFPKVELLYFDELVDLEDLKKFYKTSIFFFIQLWRSPQWIFNLQENG